MIRERVKIELYNAQRATEILLKVRGGHEETIRRQYEHGMDDLFTTITNSVEREWSLSWIDSIRFWAIIRLAIGTLESRSVGRTSASTVKRPLGASSWIRSRHVWSTRRTRWVWTQIRSVSSRKLSAQHAVEKYSKISQIISSL